MKEVYQLAIAKKKKYLVQIYAMVFGFVITCLLAIFFDALLSFSAIISFPFLVLPYFVSMQMMLIQIEERKFTRRNFNAYYKVGFIARRAFSALKNALIAVLIYFCVSMITSLILSSIPSFSSYFAGLTSIMQNSINVDVMLKELQMFVKDNELTSRLVVLLIVGVSYGIALMYFIYSQLHNALYALCKVSASLPDGKNKPVFSEVFEKIKKDYYKNYYKHEWYKLLLVPLFYAIGLFIAFITNLLGYAIYFGAAFSLLGVAIILPNLMLYQEKTYVYMFNELSKRNFDNMQKIYDTFKNQVGLTEEQQKELDRFINDLKKTIDDNKQKDDESNTNNDDN